MTPTLTIRYAQASDARRLAALAEETFRDTFGSANSAQNMDRHCKASYGHSIQRAEILDARRMTLLCCHGDDPIAYAQLRWSAAPDCVQARRPGEILRLYVDRPWHGKGVAQALMDACIAEMEKRGCDVAWLGVWERNPRAIAFYRKFAFEEVGDHVFALGEDPQRDIVMARPLRSRTSSTPELP